MDPSLQIVYCGYLPTGFGYSVSSPECANPATQPVRQFFFPSGLKNALFAGSATNTKWFAALAAIECDVPAGCCQSLTTQSCGAATCGLGESYLAAERARMP